MMMMAVAADGHRQQSSSSRRESINNLDYKEVGKIGDASERWVAAGGDDERRRLVDGDGHTFDAAARRARSSDCRARETTTTSRFANKSQQATIASRARPTERCLLSVAAAAAAAAGWTSARTHTQTAGRCDTTTIGTGGRARAHESASRE